MIRKSIFALALMALFGMPIKAHAYTEIFDKGFSTATAVGFSCSSGTTSTEITQVLSGYKIGAYRINNPESSSVFIGYDIFVSTNKANAKFGEEIPSGGSGVFPVGRDDNNSSQSWLRLWCRAADALTSGARINITLFGYK